MGPRDKTTDNILRYIERGREEGAELPVRRREKRLRKAFFSFSRPFLDCVTADKPSLAKKFFDPSSAFSASAISTTHWRR